MTTSWNAVNPPGKPMVTVSSGPISTSGADFGSDSTTNATPGNVGTGSATTTNGVQEAINWISGYAAASPPTYAGPGGTVLLVSSGGTPFIPTATINLAPNVALVGGAGIGKPAFDVVIKPSSSFSGSISGQGNQTIIGTLPQKDQSNNVVLQKNYTLRSISVDGSNVSAATDGIHITNADTFELTMVSVKGVANGISLDEYGTPNASALAGQGQLNAILTSGCANIGIDIRYQTQVQGQGIQAFYVGGGGSISLRIFSSNKVQLANVQVSGATVSSGPPVLLGYGLHLTDDGSISCHDNTITNFFLACKSGVGATDIFVDPTVAASKYNSIVNGSSALGTFSANNSNNSTVPITFVNIFGITDVGFVSVPAVPGGTGSGNTQYNHNPFRVIVYQSGGSATWLNPKVGSAKQMANDTSPVVLDPGDGIYYVTTVATKFIPKTMS